MNEFSFVHLTDLHIVAEGQKVVGIDPAVNLRAVFQKIRTMDLKPACILLGGDLTNDGKAESFEHLTQLLAEAEDLGAPFLPALGNHDTRLGFRHGFLGEADAADEHQRYYYERTLGDHRIIVLDSFQPGSVYGLLGDEQLAWLDRLLAQPASGGDIILIHHPSIPRGIPRADDFLLTDRAEFEAVLRRHRPLAVLCGHSHVSTAASFGGTLHITAPSTAFLLDPSRRQGARALDAAGFNVCTVREGRLVVNPVILEGDQRELFNH